MTRWRSSAPCAGRTAEDFIGDLTERLWGAKSALKSWTQKIISQMRENRKSSRKDGTGMSKAAKLLIAFAIGQVTQLVLHGMVVSLNMWDNRRVLFCAAFGFVILFAAIAGVYIAGGSKSAPAHEKRTYFDWAKIPEDEEVEKILENGK